MPKIAFLTPKIAFSNRIKRILNNFGGWLKSDDKLTAPPQTIIKHEIISSYPQKVMGGRP